MSTVEAKLLPGAASAHGDQPGLDYALVDVFAEKRLEGNQLAIFADARGLSDAELQALARETNLAETTFILPRDPAVEAVEGVRVRIFTTEEELPFAGHPTLGTASWLYWHHPQLHGSPAITLRLNSGPIRVVFEAPGMHAAHRPGVFATMGQQDPAFGAIHDRNEVAQVLGVPAGDLEPGLPIQTVSTGMPFVIVPFRSREAIGRLAIPQAAAERWLARAGARFFYNLAPVPLDVAGIPRVQARMQFYSGEDAATGSAAGCAISWLVAQGIVASGQPAIIEQGLSIRRPSRIHVCARRSGDKIHDVFVGGRTIQVARGRFFSH